MSQDGGGGSGESVRASWSEGGGATARSGTNGWELVGRNVVTGEGSEKRWRGRSRCAERCGDGKELTQDLGREVEGAGAELVGAVSCQEEEYNGCVFSNLFFEDRQNLVQVPDFTCPPGGGGRVVGGGDEESGAQGGAKQDAGWACHCGAAEREGGNGEESGRERPTELGGRTAASAGAGEQWSAGKWCGGAAVEGARRGKGCMGRREAPADRVGGERREAPERTRRTSGGAPLCSRTGRERLGRSVLSGRRGGSSGWGGGSGRSRWRGGKDGRMRIAPGPIIPSREEVAEG